MTNESALLHLINASIALGAAGKTDIVTEMSPKSLPRNIFEKAQDILQRMRPETEIVPGVQGENIVSESNNPPGENDPTAHQIHAPGLPTKPLRDVLVPDGGGEPIHGNWVPMDGGGMTFQTDEMPDGDNGP